MTTDSNQVCIQFWWNRKVAKAVRKYILGQGEKSNEIETGWGSYIARWHHFVICR
jgi:hypothetical protein